MIHLEPKHLKKVKQILKEKLPNLEVWAFGSRVTGKNLKPFSDLDLAILTKEPLSPGKWATLQEAFTESDLPISVDLVDFSTLSPNFRKLIKENYTVIQACTG